MKRLTGMLCLMVGVGFAGGVEGPSTIDVVVALGAMRVDFPEPAGGKLELGEFAEELEALCEGVEGNVGVQFLVGEGDGDLVVEVARLERAEAVHELLGRAGLSPKIGKGGEVTLTRAVMGGSLKGVMNEVKVDEFKLDDTEIMAALGYVGRLYAKGAKGKEVKFVAAEGEVPKGRLTLSLSQIPLGEALKYVAELGEVRLEFDEAAAVVVVTGKKK